jgi:hypothetical protein
MIEMFEFSSFEEALNFGEKWDAGIIGKECDDRTKASTTFTQAHTRKLFSITYSADDLEINANGKIFHCHQVSELINSLDAKRILIDATSLGVPELGLLLKHLNRVKKITYSILYVEPRSYTKQQPESEPKINPREFRLSTELEGFKGIPSLSRSLDNDSSSDVILFLGFESYRLKHALEELNISPKQCSLVFGVPSFRPGWETDAFDNNIKCISDNDLGGRIHYCGADNPAAVIAELNIIRSKLGDEEEIVIIPIGSKPHSIGALIFCALDPNTNLIYDHPIKSKGRSDSVGTFHLYKILKQ